MGEAYELADNLSMAVLARRTPMDSNWTNRRILSALWENS